MRIDGSPRLGCRERTRLELFEFPVVCFSTESCRTAAIISRKGTDQEPLRLEVFLRNREIDKLRERIRLLEREIALLKEERDFFRRTPTLAQGLKGETLIVKLTGGVPTGYKDPHDVTVTSGARLEVKYSHVNATNGTKTRRWNWHSVLGSANNKKYDYLVLVGEKDPEYHDQYPADLPSVFFLVPRSEVNLIKTGDDIAINTNLAAIRATTTKSLALTRHLVKAHDVFANLLRTAETPQQAVL